MAFPTTRWTLIRQAVATPSDESRAALEELCRRYSPVVLAFIRRQRSGSPDAAEDLAQDFFAVLLNGPLLERADRDVGQFRSFLLNAVRNFLADAHDYSQAQKRGGGMTRISLSSEAAPQPRNDVTPEDEFELLWARTVLQRAIDQLEAEYAETGRDAVFRTLKDLLDGSRQLTGRELASQLTMSEGAVRVALHRMRQRLGDLIRTEVADTVPTYADVDEELTRLRQILENVR